MRMIGYLIILVLMIFGISFAVLNAEIITIHYYFGVQQLPLSLLLILSFGAGLVFALLLMSFVVVQLKSKNYRLKKRLKIAEEEINNLRAIPIKDER